MQKIYEKKFYVGFPSLCELEEFSNLLKEVWGSGVITNYGPLLQKLEKEIFSLISPKANVTGNVFALEPSLF